MGRCVDCDCCAAEKVFGLCRDCKSEDYPTCDDCPEADKDE